MRRWRTPVATPEGTEREYTASCRGPIRAPRGRSSASGSASGAAGARRVVRFQRARARGDARSATAGRAKRRLEPLGVAPRGAAAPAARASSRRSPTLCRAGQRRRRAPAGRRRTRRSRARRGSADPAERVRARRRHAGTPASRAAKSRGGRPEGRQRRPIVAGPRPRLGLAGTRRTITVTGPGQNASTSRSTRATGCRSAPPGAAGDRTISGCARPPLRAKIFATAASSSARAPRPYGLGRKATSSPAASRAAASATTAASRP